MDRICFGISFGLDFGFDPLWLLKRLINLGTNWKGSHDIQKIIYLMIL